MNKQNAMFWYFGAAKTRLVFYILQCAYRILAILFYVMYLGPFLGERCNLVLIFPSCSASRQPRIGNKDSKGGIDASTEDKTS